MRDEKRSFVLPVSIISPTDVARLSREIEKIDSYFQQEEIRKPGEQETMPRMSKLMDQLATENQLNLLQPEHREYVSQSLEILHTSAPVLHMSFSVDPPGSYVQKIVAWMRKNIHAQVLVTVGLQPNIGAGCIVRTTNKIFDFSLREFFSEKRDFFIGKMHEAIAERGTDVTDSKTEDDTTTQDDSVAVEQPSQVQEHTQKSPQAQIPVQQTQEASSQ